MNNPEPVIPKGRRAKRNAAMRAQGLRLKQIWVPDTRSAEFRAEAHRQSVLLANSAGEAEAQAFVDSIGVLDALPPYDAPFRGDGSNA